MPPVERFLPRFAAEPPQEDLPYGRWAERLQAEFLSAALRIESDGEELGEPGEIVWYPDRSWHGHTYVPATVPTSEGYELYGYVRFVPAADDGEPRELTATADFTGEISERHPEWRLDLCEEVVGSWRGQFGAVATMPHVWGRPLVPGGRIVTAELADVAVDQCELVQERFTLLAPDDYRGDLLEIRLFDVRGRELARESLYDADDEDEDDGDEGDDEDATPDGDQDDDEDATPDG
jgi:hypothetical protein